MLGVGVLYQHHLGTLLQFKGDLVEPLDIFVLDKVKGVFYLGK